MPTRYFNQLAHPFHVAFLFTKSDIKTTLIPITFFAVAAAPISRIARLPHIVFWIWLHLLQFDVSNQTLQQEEDAVNKRDRPLPANLITFHNALLLRWILVPACWSLSAMYSIETLYASIALVLLTITYNECTAHSGHWVVRNVVNALGFASFEAGSTLVAGSDPHILDNTAILSICISAGIFATTIQAQDFKDEHGDRAIGRRTIPIVLPSIARYTIIVPLLLWSGSISVVWQLDFGTSFIFMGLALLVGVKYLTSKTVASDQVCFYWYNLWLSMAHALPGYYRLYAKA